MKQNKYVILSAVVAVAALAGACGSTESNKSPGPITSTGGSSSSSTTAADEEGGAGSEDTTTTKGGTKSTTTKTGVGGSSSKTKTGSSTAENGGAGSETTSEGGASDGGAASTSDTAAGGTTSTSTAGEMTCEHLKLPNDKTSFLDFSIINADKLTWGTASGDNAGLTGGIALYHGADDTITADASGGNLAVKVSMAVQGYTGITFWFGPCLDVSKYTGVSFSIGGTTPAAVTSKFMVQTYSDYPIDKENKKGSCPWTTEDERWSVCAPPYTTFSVPAEATVVKVPFSEPASGTPVASVDASELVGIQFQFECASESACEFDLTLDDISFY